LLNRCSPSLQCGSTSSSRDRRSKGDHRVEKIDPGDVAPRVLASLVRVHPPTVSS
jgi:hypothetical protein